MTSLAERAAYFNQIIVDDALDEHGLIRHQLTYPERQPIPYASLEHMRQDRGRRQRNGQKWHPHAGTPAYAMYEDANYCANRYLMAQTARWRATHDPAARQAATIALQATLYPYYEGAKIEPGYWPKPYGALRGEYAIDKTYTETSLDQAYTPTIALWRYYQHLASDAEKHTIGVALQAHSHWWIRHNYAHDFLGEPRHAFGTRIASPSNALKIPIGMHIAYQMTGDTQLRDEAVRILRQGLADGALKMHRGPRGEIKDIYHWAEMYDYFMRETELSDLADWPRLIQACWRAGQSTIQPEGLCLRMGFFNDAGLVERYEPGPIDDVSHGYWKTDALDPGSTAQMAGLAMLIQELGYDANAGRIGAQLLENVSERHFGVASFQPHFVLYTRPEQIAPAFRENPPPLFFSTRMLVFWLEAYWRGRRQGAIREPN